MSLRPGAVSFDAKWSGLRETIQAVMQLQRVRMATWNDHYSYPVKLSPELAVSVIMSSRCRFAYSVLSLVPRPRTPTLQYHFQILRFAITDSEV